MCHRVVNLLKDVASTWSESTKGTRWLLILGIGFSNVSHSPEPMGPKAKPFCGMKSWGKTVSETGVADSRAYAVSKDCGGSPLTKPKKRYRPKIIPMFDTERMLKAIMSISGDPREYTARSPALVKINDNEGLQTSGEDASPRPGSRLANNLTPNIKLRGTCDKTPSAQS